MSSYYQPGGAPLESFGPWPKQERVRPLRQQSFFPDFVAEWEPPLTQRQLRLTSPEGLCPAPPLNWPEPPPRPPGSQYPPWNTRFTPLPMPPPGLFTGYPRPGPPPVPRTPAARASLHLPLSPEDQFPSRIPTLGGRLVSRSASARTPKTPSSGNVRRRTVSAGLHSHPPPLPISRAALATVVELPTAEAENPPPPPPPISRAAPIAVVKSPTAVVETPPPPPVSPAAPAAVVESPPALVETPPHRHQAFQIELDSPPGGQASQVNTASAVKTEGCSDPAKTSIFRRRSIWRKKDASPADEALSSATAPAITTQGASVPAEASISRRRSLWRKKTTQEAPQAPQGVTAYALSSSNDPVSLQLQTAQRTSIWVEQNSQLADPVPEVADASAAPTANPNSGLSLAIARAGSPSSIRGLYPISSDGFSSEIPRPPKISQFVSTSSDEGPYLPAGFTATRNQRNFSLPAPFAPRAPTRLTSALSARQISQRSKTKPMTPTPRGRAARSPTPSISIPSMTVGPPTPTPRPASTIIEAQPPSSQEQTSGYQRLVARFFSAITTATKPGGKRQA